MANAHGIVATSALPAKEDLRTEFKSDRGPLSDSDLVAALACLANSGGGELYLGVEDSGQVTGVHARRTDPSVLVALTASKTTPRLSVTGGRLRVTGIDVFRFSVPPGAGAVMRSDGLYQRRQMRVDGTPECVPMQPHEIAGSGGFGGQSDFSADAVAGATRDDLDPSERSRLRTVLEQRVGADRTVSALTDDELDLALRLVQIVDGVPVPTVNGLLLIGRPSSLQRYLPTHEIAIQVTRGTEPGVNLHKRIPLLAALDEMEHLYELQPNEPGEVAIGMTRFQFPSVDREAFREAILNAFAHRDYRALGTVRVNWGDREIEVSSPGGLVAGVTVHSILTAPPTPRNPCLVDALKRLGLVERNARGVDRIYEGQVRYGRPLPDYSGTTAHFVLVRLDRGAADRAFYNAVSSVENDLCGGRRLAVSDTIVLSALRRARRLRMAEIASALQVSEERARNYVLSLESLRLITPHGRTSARMYTLGPAFTERLNAPTPVLADVTPPAHEQERQILQFVATHGRITRADVMTILAVSAEQAKHRLQRMAADTRLVRRGAARATHYVLPASASHDPR